MHASVHVLVCVPVLQFPHGRDSVVEGVHASGASSQSLQSLQLHPSLHVRVWCPQLPHSRVSVSPARHAPVSLHAP